MMFSKSWLKLTCSKEHLVELLAPSTRCSRIKIQVTAGWYRKVKGVCRLNIVNMLSIREKSSPD